MPTNSSRPCSQHIPTLSPTLDTGLYQPIRNRHGTELQLSIGMASCVVDECQFIGY